MIRLAAIGFALSLTAAPGLGQVLPPGPHPADSATTTPAAARGHLGIGPASVTPVTLLVDRPALESFTDRWRLEPAPKHNRGRNALIGALISGATGIITCTVISNIMKDPGTGFSTCATSGYVGLGLGGAALGALIGALL